MKAAGYELELLIDEATGILHGRDSCSMIRRPPMLEPVTIAWRDIPDRELCGVCTAWGGKG